MQLAKKSAIAIHLFLQYIYESRHLWLNVGNSLSLYIVFIGPPWLSLPDCQWTAWCAIRRSIFTCIHMGLPIQRQSSECPSTVRNVKSRKPIVLLTSHSGKVVEHLILCILNKLFVSVFMLRSWQACTVMDKRSENTKIWTRTQITEKYYWWRPNICALLLYLESHLSQFCYYNQAARQYDLN